VTFQGFNRGIWTAETKVLQDQWHIRFQTLDISHLNCSRNRASSLQFYWLRGNIPLPQRRHRPLPPVNHNG
jgi:hypothetical protein